MASVIVPKIQEPIAGPGGITSMAWYTYFQNLRIAASGNAELQAAIDEILTRLAALENDSPVDFQLLGPASVRVRGSVADGMVQLTLAGDENEPGSTYFYGTNADGEKGWHLLGDSFSTTTLAKAVDPVSGVVSYDLAELPDTGIGAALVKLTRDAYGRVEGTEAATTDDLPEGATNLYFTDERADARIELQKGQPLGLATLDANSKLDAGQLPALAITDTFVVNTEAAMLALVCQQGDVAVRTDLSKSFILTVEPASTLANWQELLAPTGSVTSFNGRTGSVVPATGDYTPAQVGAATAAQGALADTSVQKTGDESIAGSKTFTGAVALGPGSNVSDDNPSFQFRTLLGTNRVRHRYQATDAGDGPYLIQKFVAGSWVTQLEINTAGTSLSIGGQSLALLASNITDGDTTHAPSGDAVFDAIRHSGALVRLSGNAAIPSSTNTVLSFGTEIYDTDNYHDGVNPNRLTVPSNGIYVVTASVLYDTNATGYRTLAVRKGTGNFSGMGTNYTPATAGNFSGLSAVSAPLVCTAGEWFECLVTQNSGASVNILDANQTWFAIQRIATS